MLLTYGIDEPIVYYYVEDDIVVGGAKTSFKIIHPSFDRGDTGLVQAGTGSSLVFLLVK